MSTSPSDPSAGLSPGLGTPSGAMERLQSALHSAHRFVARRETHSAGTARAYAGATPTSGRQVLRSHGPFFDALHQPVWVDEFDLLPFVAVQRSGAAQAFLHILIPPGVVLTDAVALEPGSVWIAAEALAPGAPVAGYVGLRIKAGFVEFGTPLNVSVSPVIIPANATVVLQIELDSPTAFAGHGPGEDARRAHVHVPRTATFAFTPTGALVPTVDAAELVAFGQTLALRRSMAPPSFDALLGRVSIAMESDVSQSVFTVGECLSTLVTLAGDAPIRAAAWSLPVTLAGPGSFGTASGAGGLAVQLDPGLRMDWGGRLVPAPCNAAALLIAPGQIALVGTSASTPNLPMDIALWDLASPAAHGVLRLRFPRKFGFAFIVEAIGNESFALLTACEAQLDRPKTVNGERLPIRTPTALVVFGQNPLGPYLFALLQPPQGQHNARSFSLKNLILRTGNPLSLVLFAAYANARCPFGALALQFTLEFAVPILPDPYVTNFSLDPNPLATATDSGPLTVFVSWQPSALPRIDIALPPALAQARRQPSAASEQRVDPAAATSEGGIALLDVSTNVSQFGVTFGVSSGRIGGGPAPPEFAVADLFLQMQGRDLFVMTLPAVQWEPVLSPDAPSFPSPLSFNDCGNATSFVADSVELVPIAPRPAIDAIVDRFNQPVQAAAVSVRFTLPFGIVAHAELVRSKRPELLSPALLEVTPVFSASKLTGGDQLSLRAPGSWLDGNAGEESPSFTGFTSQLHNARLRGVPVVETVLTPIDDTFNANFSPAAPRPRVPLTRIDFSGFGESSFSDWRNPTDAAGVISKARFDVLVGRTSVEVVQAYSILYPYAVRVVRTITIERQNSGSVVRHDSGWQALTDGEFRYPKPDIVSHPGVVLAARRVVNIRDTGQRFATSDASELMAVRFDCAISMENAILGGGSGGVEARDQLGYVQLTDPVGNGQLAPAQYAELLAAAGTLGGGVDCVVDIGATGQRMRVARVGVATTQGTGGPEFALAAWGSPLLPAGGQWSFLRQAAPGDAPRPVDRDLGVPLVRAGAAAQRSSAAYRFADPADLLHPDSPDSDYGILHATGTQRTFFPRPKIETVGPPAITSTRAPVFADPFLLGTASGLFPRADFALSFPDANYALAILPAGQLQLQRPMPSFMLPSPRRVLFDSKAVRTSALYADELGNPSVVTLAIDTSAAESWSIGITNVSLVSESGSHGEVSRVVSRLDASSSRPSQYGDARLVFGPCLQPVQGVVTFLENFGPMPPLSISMTNDASLKVKGKLDLPKWLEVSAPATKVFLEKFIVDLDFTIGQTVAPYSTDQEIEFELTVKIPTPFTIGAATVVAIGIAKFTIKESSDFGSTYLFQLGAGIGVDFKIGTFGAIAYYAETASLIIGDNDFGLATSVLIKGTVDLEVIEIDVSVEAAMGLIRVDCNGGADTSIWGVAQVTFALEVTICWVIDIDFEEKAEWTSNWNGGACALPDVM